MGHTFSAWSYSRLLDFEACKYRAKLKYLDKIPEPARPLPKGKTEHAMDRGARIHEAAELYVKGGVELVPELVPFGERFQELRALYASKHVVVEEEWAVNRQWESVAWRSEDAWMRLKVDAMVMEDPVSAKVIDYKTGKRYGNEVKHTEQGQLYQLAAFMRFPSLQYIEVEFWYVDQGLDEDLSASYTREQGTSYFAKFHKRGEALTDATDFPPNPNAFTCKWCPYLGNACEYGVSKSIIKASGKDKSRHTPTGIAALFGSK